MAFIVYADLALNLAIKIYSH